MVAAVICGSRHGTAPRYARAARELGTGLARASITVVYGGARLGLMGTLADAALNAGGRVEGVIAQSLLDYGVEHRQLSQLSVVPDLAEQQAMMLERADAFVALPGGLGTLYELTMVITAAQLGLHDKPIVVANVGGYFAPFLAALEHADAEGFVSVDDTRLLLPFSTVAAAVAALRDLRDARTGTPITAAVENSRRRGAELAALAHDLLRQADAPPPMAR